MAESSAASFDFENMIQGLDKYVDNVKKYLKDLEQGSSNSTVDLSTMFNLQFRMQIMTQYVEAVSNVLTAVHNEMMNMAKATKGQ